MILLLDHFDSFVHTLARYVRELGHDVRVVRCDAVTEVEIEALAPAAVVLSPGPCTPRETGVTLPFLRRSAGTIPVFGVCLGHQCIVEALGGRVANAREPTHGAASLVHHTGDPLFAGIPSPFPAGRYHSLATPREDLPPSLRLIAWESGGEVMAVGHGRLPVWGVQFHPESILTRGGHRLLANFLSLAGVQGGRGAPGSQGAAVGAHTPATEPPGARAPGRRVQREAKEKTS